MLLLYASASDVPCVDGPIKPDYLCRLGVWCRRGINSPVRKGYHNLAILSHCMPFANICKAHALVGVGVDAGFGIVGVVGVVGASVGADVGVVGGCVNWPCLRGPNNLT